MAALPATRIRRTPEEYLEWETHQEEKHEFYDGETLAMAGGTETHSSLITNTLTLLKTGLRGCKVHSEAMRIHVEAAGLFTYPDISVVCGDATFSDERRTSLTNPVLIVEVLSPSTETYDRGQKFRFYRMLPSLREYVLIAQERPTIEVFRRDESDRWTLYEPDEYGILPLDIGVDLVVSEIYDGVTFPATGDRPRGG